MSPSSVAIDTPERGESRAIAELLAEAFLDDPVWSAIGPARLAHRRIAMRVAFAGVLAASRRHGGRIRIARDHGRPVGATIAFEPGSWPMPDRAGLWDIGWLIVAGPRAARRGLRDDREMQGAHPPHPHTYLWFLGVEPARQGRGVGSELLDELHAGCEHHRVPTYLETATRANVALYERHGYSVIGELRMPSGARMWRMERPPRPVPPT